MKSPKAKELMNPFQSGIVESFNSLKLGEASKKIQKIIAKTAKRLSKDISSQLKEEVRFKLKAEQKEQRTISKEDKKTGKAKVRKTKTGI